MFLWFHYPEISECHSGQHPSVWYWHVYITKRTIFKFIFIQRNRRAGSLSPLSCSTMTLQSMSLGLSYWCNSQLNYMIPIDPMWSRNKVMHTYLSKLVLVFRNLYSIESNRAHKWSCAILWIFHHENLWSGVKDLPGNISPTIPMTVTLRSI